jgi:hypothetical protein
MEFLILFHYIISCLFTFSPIQQISRSFLKKPACKCLPPLFRLCELLRMPTEYFTGERTLCSISIKQQGGRGGAENNFYSHLGSRFLVVQSVAITSMWERLTLVKRSSTNL